MYILLFMLFNDDCIKIVCLFYRAGPDSTATAGIAEAEKRKPVAFLGLGAPAYDGRHSEGNRFIVDKHL